MSIPNSMQNAIVEIYKNEFPPLLNEINDPPRRLYLRGQLPDPKSKFLCVVGARRCTSYGTEACKALLTGLRGYKISILSGLALGIDSLAHETAIKINLPAIACPGSGLNWDVLYPKANFKLAERIIESGGALISEFEPGYKARAYTFEQRNRIMAGSSHAILIIEGSLSSGTLITARLGLDYNRDILAVPGSIFSKQSEGSHLLINNGARIVRHSNDILEALGLEINNEEKIKNAYEQCSKVEKHLISLLDYPCNKDELIVRSKLEIRDCIIAISILEMRGLIVVSGGEIRRV